jgi:antitoxin component YwqK of YwqJK toxin-antitoxin module
MKALIATISDNSKIKSNSNMKKLLVLLFSILVSLNSYSQLELDFSLGTFCEESSKVQVRNNRYYLPNTEKPYSGKTLCVYSSNGQYYSQGKIKDGLWDGKTTYWFENGQKWKEENWDNGVINGKWFIWHKNGQLESELNFKDNNEDGKQTSWYEDGQIRWELNYKDGIADGVFTWWHEDGQKKSEITYEDNNLVSQNQYEYNNDSQLVYIGNYSGLRLTID